MERIYIEDKHFEKVDFTSTAFVIADYETCKFINCNFSNTDLSKINFIDSEFTGCNLSMARLIKTGFRDCKFTDCKLTGLHFEDCDDFLFTVHFVHCILNLSSFYQMKLKKIIFRDSSLHEVDFTESDLSGSVISNCDLNQAIFKSTILEKSDLRGSYNYSIDPEQNRIKKAKFSLATVAGLLDRYDIEIEG